VAAGERLKTEPGLRVVVLSGEGRAFCAGLDKSNFERMGSAAPNTDKDRELGRLGQRTHGIANKMQYVAWVWREVPVPVIAALHGFAFGGGFQIALGADIRIATPDTKLSVMEMKWGLVPDMSGIALMRTLARDDVIRELTYTARIFSAQEGVGLGFVTKLSADPLADALALAGEIAGRNPDAVRAAKRLMNACADGTNAQLLQAESDEQDRIIGGANQIEAVLSQLQQRPARYAG